jgi:predicted nucleic acid-binding protein
MLLLDTNVISELRRVRIGKAAPNVARWAETLDTATLFISAVTIHELEIGIARAERRDPPQAAVLRLWLETLVLTAFDNRILPVDVAVGKVAAKWHVPDPYPINDAFIAATAVVHGLTVVTRNISDFAGTGVPLLNPWDALAE